MSISNTKIVQALVQALVDVSNKVVIANNAAQSYKTKFQNINPDLTGTGLTSGQITAINTWLASLNSLATDNLVTTVQGKNQSSHGTSALG